MRKQNEYMQLARTILSARYPDAAPKAFVHTYGCQGNVADSERIKGQLKALGYEFTENKEDADFVLFNTCAVREHAEDRVFGNVGALKPIKNERKGMIIALCGCMMQQEHVAERIKRSYPFVNLVFGTFAVYRLPELLYRVLSSGRRVFEIAENPADLAEGLPVYRDHSFKTWLPIMYGCLLHRAVCARTGAKPFRRCGDRRSKGTHRHGCQRNNASRAECEFLRKNQ